MGIKSLSVQVQVAFARTFTNIGLRVGARPGLTVLLAMTLGLLSCAGFSQMRQETDSDKLWVPQASTALADKKRYSEVWGSKGSRREKFIAVSSGCDLGDRNTMGDQSGCESVLTPKAIQDLHDFDELTRTFRTKGDSISHGDTSTPHFECPGNSEKTFCVCDGDYMDTFTTGKLQKGCLDEKNASSFLMYERECARIEGHVANGIVPHDHGDAATHRVTGDASSCTTKSIEWGDVCTRGAGDNPQCVVVGHPLEFWYRIGGTFCIGDDAALLTDDDGSFLCNDTAIADPQPLPWASSDIVARVNSRKGIDPLVFSDSSSFSVDLVGMMGGATCDDAALSQEACVERGTLTGAKAISWFYLLDPGREEWDGNDPLALTWEQSAKAIADGKHPELWNPATRDIKVYTQTEEAVSVELGKAIRGDLISLNVALFTIIIYSILVLGAPHPSKSRSLLAVQGVGCVLLAIGSSYGLALLLGFWITPVTNTLPFILIGIGADDMFVLVNSYDAATEGFDDESVPLRQRVVRRVAHALAHAGVSITITSVTDFVAFFLGATSALPALSNFCVFAAFGVIYNYVYMITIFAACMVWDGERRALRRRDCVGTACCTPCCGRSDTSCGGRAVAADVRNGICCCCSNLPCLPDHSDGAGRVDPVRKFLATHLAPQLAKKGVKAAVIFVFVGWFAFSGFLAMTELKQDFRFRWFVPDDAELQWVFDAEDSFYGELPLPVTIAVPRQSTRGESNVQDVGVAAAQISLRSLGPSVRANAHIEPTSWSSWYDSFHEWVQSCDEEVNFSRGPQCQGTGVKRSEAACNDGTKVWPACSSAPLGAKALDANGNVPPENFHAWLHEYASDVPQGGRFVSDLVWGDSAGCTAARAATGATATSVRAACALHDSKMRAAHRDIGTAAKQIDAMRTLRADIDAAIAKDGGGLEDVYAMAPTYPFFEQYAVIVREAIQNIVLAVLAVFFIVLVLVASLKAALFVMLMILMVEIDLLGLLVLWDLTIDAVSIVNIVLAIGLAVDYSAHVAHGFLTATGTRDERMHTALTETGTAVLHGVNSTFLAVLVLASSNSYIFRCLFKMFFGISVFGAMHGMVLLPVLLSLWGPDSTAGTTASTKAVHVEMAEADKAKVPQATPADEGEGKDGDDADALEKGRSDRFDEKGRRVSPSELDTGGLRHPAGASSDEEE